MMQRRSEAEDVAMVTRLCAYVYVRGSRCSSLLSAQIR